MPITYGPCMAYIAFLAYELLGSPGLFWRHLLALKQVSSRRLFPYITPNPWFPAPGPYFAPLGAGRGYQPWAKLGPTNPHIISW